MNTTAIATKTVLLVDDFASVRFYHETLLKRAGYATLVAQDGQEALQMLEKNHVDLLMLDLNMPNKGDLEVLLRIGTIPHLSRLPVIVVTSEAKQLENTQLTCKVLQKPVSPEALLRLTSELLSQSTH